MPFHKKINVGFQDLTNLFNINYTKVFSFDLTGCFEAKNSIDKDNHVNQFNFKANGLNLEITGWTCSSFAKSSIKQIFVRNLNGLSIIEENQNDYSMLMLSFDQTVSLISLELGWIEGDNNVSILALNNDKVNYFSDKQWPQLLSDGWSPAGEYFNLDYRGNGNRVNLSNIVSKHWLIGSYNPNLYNYFSNNTDQNCQFDRFKLQNITVSTENIIIRAKKLAEKNLLGQKDNKLK